MHLKNYFIVSCSITRSSHVVPRSLNEDAMPSDHRADLAGAGPTDGNVGQTAPKRAQER